MLLLLLILFPIFLLHMLLLLLLLLLPIRLFFSSAASFGARPPASLASDALALSSLAPVAGVLALRQELVRSCWQEVNLPAWPDLPDHHTWVHSSTVSPI